MKFKDTRSVSQAISPKTLNKLGIQWNDLFNPSLSIHANRELDMSQIKMVGFDMDYTLAVYKKTPMETLQYRLAQEFLINENNYPKELLDHPFNADLVIRGLVIDRHLGNIIKLDDQNLVWRARHCHIDLSPEQIAHFYGQKRVKASDERYYSLDTFFSIPEAVLFINTLSCFYELEKNHQQITPFKIKNGDMLDFEKIFGDVRHAVDTIHSNGALKRVITDNIAEYVHDDNEIAQTLKKLSQDGKKLFLLTNSGLEYSDKILSYVFADKDDGFRHWQDYFDIIIVNAQKPRFFTEDLPFTIIDNHNIESITKPIYSGGNIDTFHDKFHAYGEEVLYVGDHIYGDILRSKKESLWRTCLIIKELSYYINQTVKHLSEFKSLRRIQDDQEKTDRRLERLRTLRKLIEEYQGRKDKLFPHQVQKLDDEIKREIKSVTHKLNRLNRKHAKHLSSLEETFHEKWGRHFREKQELSRFGAQVRQYACIYTDHVKNFLRYGQNHTFFARKEMMSHENDLV